jgi:para-aminobenzoate synthetase component 1
MIELPMRRRHVIEPLEWLSDRTPLDVSAAWPRDRQLVMLHSGRLHRRWSRWSILTTPREIYEFDGRSNWRGTPTEPAAGAKFRHDPLHDIDAIVNATRCAPQPPTGFELPFQGGWIGFLSYDLGAVIEPRAVCANSTREFGNKDNQVGDPWPLVELAHCPAALLHDRLYKTWWHVGDDSHLQSVLEHVSSIDRSSARHAPYSIAHLRSQVTAEQYMRQVRRAIEYIAAGDIFQANIAQRFQAQLIGSPRALGVRAMTLSQPWYGAYIESSDRFGDRILISLSPELFLRIDGATRQITTRPIKGTRPSSTHRGVLVNAPKDIAELNMIIDLMRNDLGRVCEFGSVCVTQPRAIETHPTVHHGVGEIAGRLRMGVSVGEVMRATFPGGSVTGAPKIRAMQIIDALEPVRRGPYCGSIGYVSNCGKACFNIAIRTIMIRSPASAHSPGRQDDRRQPSRSSVLHYFAGAGIVADSDPESEYRETLDKAAVLRMLAKSAPPRRLRRNAGQTAVNI